MLKRTAGSSAPLTYINAGANKGFAVAEFLQRFHDNGSSTLSFGIRDVDSALERLRALDVEWTRIDIPQTVTLIEFEDLDGNHLMLHGPPVK